MNKTTMYWLLPLVLVGVIALSKGVDALSGGAEAKPPVTEQPATKEQLAKNDAAKPKDAAKPPVKPDPKITDAKIGDLGKPADPGKPVDGAKPPVAKPEPVKPTEDPAKPPVDKPADAATDPEGKPPKNVVITKLTGSKKDGEMYELGKSTGYSEGSAVSTTALTTAQEEAAAAKTKQAEAEAAAATAKSDATKAATKATKALEAAQADLRAAKERGDILALDGYRPAANKYPTDKCRENKVDWNPATSEYFATIPDCGFVVPEEIVLVCYGGTPKVRAHRVCVDLFAQIEAQKKAAGKP